MTQSFSDPGIPQSGNSGATRTANVDLTANVSGYTSQMNSAAQSTGLLSQGVDQLSGKMAGLNKWAGKKLFHFAAADFGMLATATADAATFEKQLSTLAATASITGTSMKGIKGGIESAFTKFPVARGQVVELVEAITNLGVTSSSSIGSLTQTFIKLGAATGEPMTQLASGLVQLSRLMGATDAGQIGNYANSLLTVSKNAGVSASGVLQFAQSIAPIARQAGIGEAAVIGISTAFSKAGADGFVATNTFNSMLSGITSSIATGSPELSKYANLIGVTTDAFKKMDKTNAMVQIFQAISKQGPQAIAVLNSLGIEGTRAQAAIAAVTQSGDLQKSIDQALGAQGGQGNLNKGSKAAFDNLADSMTNVRNQFTQFGDEIGKTFLTPMTAAANLSASVAKHLNALVAPFAPIIAGMAGVAGGAAAAGSMALSAAGAIGAYALVRNVRHGMGGPLTAFRGGMTVGGPNENLSKGAPIDRYTSGQMSRVERMMFMGGTRFGPTAQRAAGRLGITGRPSPFRDPQVLRNAMAAGPLAFMRGVSRMNENFLNGSSGPRMSSLPYMQRLNLWGEGLRGKTMLQAAAQEAKPLAGQMGRTTAATTRVGAMLAGRVGQAAWAFAGPTVMGALVGGATGIPGGGRLANAGIRGLPTGSISQEWEGVKQAGRNLGTAVSGVRSSIVPLRLGFAATGNAAKDLAASLLRTAGTVSGAGVGLGVRGIGMGIGRGVGLAARGVGMLARGAFSLPGMMAIMGGQALLSADNKAQNAGNVDKFLNPIQKYNDMLGITTSNLANFNNALAEGAKVAPVTTMKDAATIGASDQTNAPNKPKNDYWTALKGSSRGKDKDYAYAAALSAMPISDPKQLQAAKEDMFAAGISERDVKKTLDIYMKAGGPNAVSGIGNTADRWRNLGISISNTEGSGTDWSGDMSKSKAGGKLTGLMMSGIDSQRISDEQTTGGAYAQQKALQSYAQGLAPVLDIVRNGGSKGQREAGSKQLADALHEIAGGDKSKYVDYIFNHGSDPKNQKDQEQFLINALGSTKQGKQWENALTSHGGTLNVSAMSQKLVDLSNTGDGSSFNGLLRKTGGAMGRFAADSTTVQSAIGINQSNPGAVNQSIQALLDNAVKLGGGFEGAQAQLAKFQGAIGDSTSVLYKQVTAAQQMASQEAGYRQPFQTRSQKFAAAVQGYQGAQAAYDNTPVDKRTDEQNAFRLQKKGDFEAALAEQQSYLQQTYQTAQNYGTQMKRGAEDETEQIKRSWAQFHLQMQQGNEDYLRNRNRSQADHDKSLANQVAQAAQSIYDPYQRVQAKYVLSGGEVEQNLAEQNEKLVQQKANLDKLRKEGLSKQAIETLNLADPNNAAQANELVASFANDPKQIAKINKDAATRGKATKAITQSPYNLAFSQGEADYKLQLSRAQADYDTAVKRAQKQQEISLGYMASDYTKTVNRAGEDLTTAMTEVTGNFGNMYDRTMGQIAASVGKFSPKAAAQMKKDLQGIADAFPGLGLGNAPGYGGRTAITTPGTMGKNAQGVVGEYSKDGKFHAMGGGVLTRAAQDQLPLIAPPPKAKATATGSSPTAPSSSPMKLAQGGITVGPTLAMVSEWSSNAAEAHIPLNERGQAFMAGLIAKALGQAMVMVSGGGHSSSTTVDSSTRYTGPITVVAQDTKIFEREMKAKARLKKLSSPVRH